MTQDNMNLTEFLNQQIPFLMKDKTSSMRSVCYSGRDNLQPEENFIDSLEIIKYYIQLKIPALPRGAFD